MVVAYLTGVPNILPLMYVNGVDKILGTPVNIMHLNTPPITHYDLNHKLHKCRIERLIAKVKLMKRPVSSSLSSRSACCMVAVLTLIETCLTLQAEGVLRNHL